MSDVPVDWRDQIARVYAVFASEQGRGRPLRVRREARSDPWVEGEEDPEWVRRSATGRFESGGGRPEEPRARISLGGKREVEQSSLRALTGGDARDALRAAGYYESKIDYYVNNGTSYTLDGKSFVFIPNEKRKKEDWDKAVADGINMKEFDKYKTTPEKDAEDARAALERFQKHVDKMPDWAKSQSPVSLDIDDVAVDAMERAEDSSIFRFDINGYAVSDSIVVESGMQDDKALLNIAKFNPFDPRFRFAHQKSTDLLDVVLAHEMGHIVDNNSDRNQPSAKEQNEPGDEKIWEEWRGSLGSYAKTSDREAYAEAYARWSLGIKDDKAVEAYAERYGWDKTEDPMKPPLQKLFMSPSEQYPDAIWTIDPNDPSATLIPQPPGWKLGDPIVDPDTYDWERHRK